MKQLTYLALLGALLLAGCGEDQEASQPRAGLTVYKATSALPFPSDTVTLQPGADVVLRAGDTLMIESLCTGEHNYLYTGDTIFNDDREVNFTRIADERDDITYAPQIDEFRRTEALLFPAENQDLFNLFGYEERRQYQNEAGEYYRGMIPYVYEYSDRFRLKVYSVNYSDDGRVFRLDTASVFITVLDSIP